MIKQILHYLKNAWQYLRKSSRVSDYKNPEHLLT